MQDYRKSQSNCWGNSQLCLTLGAPRCALLLDSLLRLIFSPRWKLVLHSFMNEHRLPL